MSEQSRFEKGAAIISKLFGSAGGRTTLSEDFRKLAARSPSPHGAPGKVSPRIVEVLKTVPLAGLTLKRFHSR